MSPVFRVWQIDHGRTDILAQGAGPPLTNRTTHRARTGKSPVLKISTRSSASISRRLDERRARICATYTGLFSPIRDFLRQRRRTMRASTTWPVQFQCEARLLGGSPERWITPHRNEFFAGRLRPYTSAADAAITTKPCRQKFKAMSIADLLEMTVEEALLFTRKRISQDDPKPKTLMDARPWVYSFRAQRNSPLRFQAAFPAHLLAQWSSEPQADGPDVHSNDEPTTGLHFE